MTAPLHESSAPAPYYQDAAVTIYHGDCREILPQIEADVLVTDPPYGVEFDGKATKRTRGGKPGGYTTEDDGDVGPAIVRDALRRVVRGAVFPGNRMLFRYPEPRDIGCVFVPSGAGIGPAGFTCFHPILYYGPRASNVLRPTSMQSLALADKVDHPCPKPMPWLRWLLQIVSNEGETVLDPFMGSGTTVRAAKDLGRRAIGIDIEERYCEVAVKRLGQEVLDFGAAA